MANYLNVERFGTQHQVIYCLLLFVCFLFLCFLFYTQHQVSFLAHNTRQYTVFNVFFVCFWCFFMFLFDTQHQVSYFAYCCCSCLFWHTAPGDMHCLLFLFCSLCFCLAASARCHSLLVVVVFASF